MQMPAQPRRPRGAVALARHELSGFPIDCISLDTPPNHFRHRRDIAIDVIKFLHMIRLRPAVSCPNRIDKNQIGEVEPRIRILFQPDTAGAGGKPFSGNATRLGPAVPKCNQTDADPGPPLNTKVIGLSPRPLSSSPFFS